MAPARNALLKNAKSVKTNHQQNGGSVPQARRPAVKTYHNYINGEWRPSASGETFENLNPADTRDVVGRFPLSTAEDIGHAVAAARAAADKWRRTPAPRRAEILFRLGELLMRRKEDYARAMTREMGKVLKETGGDVQEAIDCTFYTAGEGRRLHGFTTPAEMPDKFAMCAAARWFVRLDYAVELSDGDPVMEINSRPGLRQHRGHQAGRRYSAFVP
ncbi:MAG: aldehyde dehydrogenase family protein [Pyrinomonadaceae bacterium]